MTPPLISVLIPVYNTEPYLRECLDSVLGQTYKNLDIIIVDDGSTDNGGAICDEYAARDSRVRVIHQENGGISSARNRLLAEARGEYIGWVDSDDRIEPDMYEYLMDGAEQTGADIAVCGRVEEWARFARPMHYPEGRLLSCGEALEELIRDQLMQNYVWDKLFRRETISGVTFPVGQSYEDIAVMYKIFEAAGSVAVLPECKYHYRLRGSSITDVKDYAMLRKTWHSMLLRYNVLAPHRPELEKLLAAECVGCAVMVWSAVWPQRNSLSAQQLEELREMSQFAREHLTGTLACTCMGITGKIRALLTPYANNTVFWCCYQLEKVYRLKHSRQAK